MTPTRSLKRVHRRFSAPPIKSCERDELRKSLLIKALSSLMKVAQARLTTELGRFSNVQQASTHLFSKRRFVQFTIKRVLCLTSWMVSPITRHPTKTARSHFGSLLTF